MSHETEIIHKSKNGYVLACVSCYDLQIGFGNMLLVYQKEEFKGFKNYIDSIEPNHVYFESPVNKNIYVKMQGMSFGYALSKKELIELKQLLNTSWDILKLKEMVAEALQ